MIPKSNNAQGACSLEDPQPKFFPTINIDTFKKKCLLNGLDDIDLSLEKEEKIFSYESKQKKIKPWVY